MFEHQAGSSQRALDLVLERCAPDEKCHAAFPNLRSDLPAAFAQLEKQPVKTAVWDLAANQSISVTSAVFASVVHETLMGADSAAQLPRLAHRAAANKDVSHASDSVSSMKRRGEK